MMTNAQNFSVINFDDTKEMLSYLDELQHEKADAVFRGHSRAEWQLIPSAWRSGGIIEKRKDDLLREFGNQLLHMLPTDLSNACLTQNQFQGDGEERLTELVAWLCAEEQAVDEFCSLCDSVALPVPGFSAPIAPRLFKSSSTGNVPAQDYGSEVAFAQHFGIPTRFLDFTENALKALYFAASGVSHGGLLQLSQPAFAVVVAWPQLADLEEYFGVHGDSVRVRRFLRSEIPRLHAQDGLFLICNERANSWFLETGTWPSFDLVTKNWMFEVVTAPAELAMDAVSRLRRKGIYEVRMKPSYETAAAEFRASKSGNLGLG